VPAMLVQRRRRHQHDGPNVDGARHGDNWTTQSAVTMDRVNASLDGLSLRSTAQLSESVPVDVPGVAQEPPRGWSEIVDGRGVYLRRTDHPELADPPTGPDAWYVHGLAGSSTNWISLAGALAGAATGYLVDLPGHGRSDPPPRGRYSLVDDAEVTAALIRRHSDGPVHLVGNSLGGVVSTVLAARHPDLVATLTLISPAVPDLRLTRDRGADPILGLLLFPGTGGLAVRRLSSTSPMARARGMGELCFGDPTLLTDDDYAVAAADLAWRSSIPWVHTGTIGSLRALLRSYLHRTESFWADAASVRVPTLVIWGTRDRLVDVRLAPRTAAAFADSSLLIMAGVGHTAQMEDPVTTARAVSRLWGSPGAPHPGLTDTVATSTR
jgi:pimeloyl-ACP methyl ester carboxylesterase